MKIAIMQPYFLPYIGYFQLMRASDIFVVYDNIQYIKQSWINRNRILENDSDVFITLPIKKDSDYFDIRERFLSDSWEKDKLKIINRVKSTYRRAPYFDSVFPIFESIVHVNIVNLFDFIFNSLIIIKEYLEIKTKLVISSEIMIDHELRKDAKVIAICHNLLGDTYINPIGGINLYSKESFKSNGLDLLFLKSREINYSQFTENFIPWLSILDIMMFKSRNEIINMLEEYNLI